MMRRASASIVTCMALAAGLLGAAPKADAARVTSTGKITLLRVHDVGTKFGAPSDQLDVEVIVLLDTQPDRAFGFQLRNDGNSLARRGMLDLLRDAFDRNWTVAFDSDIDEGKKNGRIIRVWLTK